MEGSCDALLTTIRAKENPIVAHLSFAEGKIDLVDENQAVLASKEVADSDCKTVGQAVMDFFAEKDIPIEQVVDVKVSLQEGMDANQSLAELKEVIPCPVHIG